MSYNGRRLLNFRNENNPKIVLDPIEYTLNFLENNKDRDIKIYVGCDSQNSGGRTVYVTTICFRVGTRGTHVIYHKEKVPEISEEYTYLRLQDEYQRTLAVANMLEENGISVYQVDLDYNSDKKERSSGVAEEGRGVAKGLGYRVGIKPGELVAARAADHLANGG